MISKPVKVSWGIGAVGVALLMNSVGFLALFYMIGILSIEPAVAGAIIFVTKIFDVLSDPLVGGWSDSLKVNKSRRRPFLFFGAIISALSFVMIFTTPVFDNQIWSIAYIFLALSIYTIGYTIFNVPYMAMPAEMTDNYHERSSIHAYRMVFVAIGSLMAVSLGPLLLEKLGRESWSSYAVLGVGGAVIIFITMIIAWLGTSTARFTTAPVETPKLLSEMAYVFKNKFFIRLLGVKALLLFGTAAMNAAFVFYFLHVLRYGMDTIAFYGTVLVITSIIASPFLVNLSQRIGKRLTFVFAALCMSISFGSWVFAGPEEPMWAVIIRAMLIGIGGAGNIIMAMSMLTDIVNFDAQSSGVRREGIFTAFYSFTEKFTFALGPLVVGVAMSLVGFDQNLEPEQLQSPAIRQALLLGVCYIPAVCCFLSIFVLWGYRLTKEDVDVDFAVVQAAE